MSKPLSLRPHRKLPGRRPAAPAAPAKTWVPIAGTKLFRAEHAVPFVGGGGPCDLRSDGEPSADEEDMVNPYPIVPETPAEDDYPESDPNEDEEDDER